MSSEKRWKFESRWMLEGILTTRSFLHIGSGETDDHLLKNSRDESGNKKVEKVKVNAVIKDHEGKCFIPGSTLKGNMRAWLEGRILDYSILEAVFGSKSVKKDETVVGGKAEFHGAFLAAGPPSTTCTKNFDGASGTDITVGVAIDRRTCMASDKKLFHQEVVPPGTAFKICITGQNMSDAEILILLQGLEGFGNQMQSVALGAGTSDGWGLMKWELKKVNHVDRVEAVTWLGKVDAAVGYDIPGKDRTGEFCRKVSGNSLPTKETASLRLDLEISFAGPFLVNDPSRVVHSDNAADKTPDHMPRLDPDGKVVLPASSLRGCFRSQAERIVRTIGRHACRVDDTANRCKPVYSEREKQSLCPVCRAFGAAGWKTPLDISDFKLKGNVASLKQEFVAIDRFAGGSRESAKFNAEAVVSPVFTGAVIIDLKRIDPADAGLLALTLRDLLEGDITFGFGSAKGYGACTAKIVGATLSAPPRWAQEAGLGEIAWKDGDDALALLEAAAGCVQQFCEVTK
jgi:CRISPR/Cas system CSM-associated protein Csm3 (group 7 of RAMP superfamily)